MGTDLNVLILFYKFQSVSNYISVESDLIICLYIHEVIQISILIQILHFLSLDVCILELLCRTECLLYYTTTDDVFQFCSYERCTFTRFNVLEFQNLENISLNLNCISFRQCNCSLQTFCFYHSILICDFFQSFFALLIEMKHNLLQIPL